MRSKCYATRYERMLPFVKFQHVLSLGPSGSDVSDIETEILTSYSRRWDGLDIQKESRTFHNGVIHQHDLNKTPLPIIEGVQVITCCDVLEHLDSPSFVLDQIVKKYPCRRVYITLPNGGSIGKLLLNIFDPERADDQEISAQHIEMCNAGTATVMCKRRGLVIDEIGFYESHPTFRPFTRIFPRLSQGIVIVAYVPACRG